MEIMSSRVAQPPPVLEGLFTPVMLKGEDDMVLANDKGFNNELVAKILLNIIILKEDAAKYKNKPMGKLMTWQKQLLYAVNFSFCLGSFLCT